MNLGFCWLMLSFAKLKLTRWSFNSFPNCIISPRWPIEHCYHMRKGLLWFHFCFIHYQNATWVMSHDSYLMSHIIWVIVYGTYEIHLDIVNFCFQRFTDRCLARCKRTGSPGFLSLIFFLNACKRSPCLLPSKGCIWNERFFSFQIRCAWLILINSCLLDLVYILCRSCAEMRLCCPMTIKMGWNFSRTLMIIMNSQRTSFCLWNLDMSQLYFWSV